MHDNPTLAWTVMALLDAAIMVHSHLWDQLNDMALYLVADDGVDVSHLLHILTFSRCLHSSLACSVADDARDGQSSGGCEFRTDYTIIEKNLLVLLTIYDNNVCNLRPFMQGTVRVLPRPGTESSSFYIPAIARCWQ